MFAPRNSSPPLSYSTNNDDIAAHQVIEQEVRKHVSGNLKCKQLRNLWKSTSRVSNFDSHRARWCNREVFLRLETVLLIRKSQISTKHVNKQNKFVRQTSRRMLDISFAEPRKAKQQSGVWKDFDRLICQDEERSEKHKTIVTDISLWLFAEAT